MNPSDDVIEVRNLVYHVGGRAILDGISFSVCRGCIFGVMGMSGTGKSTLLKCLMGLLRAESGEVIVDGDIVTGVAEQELARVRSKMGMCFQYAALFDSLTVAENVAFGLKRHTHLPPDEISLRVADALAHVRLRDIDNLMPAQLSGGMRKRVGIARALVIEPMIMLYDEPSAGLDPITAAVLDDLILSLAREHGMTCVIVTHEVRELFSLCDSVMMLHEGRIVALDTPDRLKRSPDPIVEQFVEGRPIGPIAV
jgi:phospholipid/cholesterol/gamma-HCH transport system ATP-binding protein